ncbi:MAG: excinuclease ABC subunit UvrB [Patescibacteria group bacterium]|jgi:excinuclease ABC subunit B
MSFQLKAKFKPTGDQPQAINKLVAGLKNKYPTQTLLGVTGSGKTFTMANVIAKMNKPALIISHNKTLAAQLASEFQEFFPENEVHYFVSFYDYYQPEAYIPRTDTYIEKDADINDEIDRLRHAATQALLTDRQVIIVASVSCIYSLGSPDEYKKYSLPLFKGKNYSRRDFLKKLVEMKYMRSDAFLKRGTFAVRGEAVEIFPALFDKFTFRLNFYQDKLEKISKINLLSGEVVEELKEIYIFPAKHYMVPEELRQQAYKQISADLKKEVANFKKQKKLLEAQRLQERVQYDLEMLMQTGFVNGIENYSRYFDGRKTGDPAFTLLDFFPKDFLLFIDESHITVPQLRGMYSGDRARKENLVNYGWRLKAAMDNRPLKYEEFKKKINQAILVSATPSEENLKESRQVVEQMIRPTGLLDPQIELKPTRNQLKHLITEIEKRTKNKQRVLVTTMTKKLAEELAEYLKEENIAVQYLHSDIDTLERLEILRDLRSGVFDVVVGINLLREGLDLPEVSLVAILDADKESFLRDKTSLMQIMGRAARHLEGKVIMYADRITKSMKAAIDETNRRRKIQETYNNQHHITPTSIKKAINVTRLSGMKEKTKEVEPIELAKKLPKAERAYIIRELTSQMHLASENMEFEKAAILRDQIKLLKR